MRIGRNISTVPKPRTILPPGTRAAFEFRHASWFDDDVYAARRALRASDAVAQPECFILCA
jgi:hypothetical protein